MGKDYNTTRSNTTSVNDGPSDPISDIDISGTKTDVGGHLLIEATGKAPGGEGGGSEKSGAIDHNSTRSNRGASVSGGGGTTGLKSTLGMMKSAFTLTTIIVLIAAGADVYKMYDDHVTINLEDHITDANFWLTPDKNSIVGDIVSTSRKWDILRRVLILRSTSKSRNQTRLQMMISILSIL